MSEENNKIMEVPVALNERVVSEEEAIAAMKRQGVTHVRQATIRDMASIGIHVVGAGVLKIQRGKAMVNQQRLENAMEVLSEAIESTRGEKTAKAVSKMLRAAHCLGYLSSKYTESQTMIVEMERLQGPSQADAPEPLQQSFKPGTSVRAALPPTMIQTKEVHIHNPPAALTT